MTNSDDCRWRHVLWDDVITVPAPTPPGGEHHIYVQLPIAHSKGRRQRYMTSMSVSTDHEHRLQGGAEADCKECGTSYRTARCCTSSKCRPSASFPSYIPSRRVASISGVPERSMSHTHSSPLSTHSQTYRKDHGRAVLLCDNYWVFLACERVTQDGQCKTRYRTTEPMNFGPRDLELTIGILLDWVSLSPHCSCWCPHGERLFQVENGSSRTSEFFNLS